MNAEIGYVVVFPSPPGEYCEFNAEVTALCCLRSRSSDGI
jgi:hypothetical protein